MLGRATIIRLGEFNNASIYTTCSYSLPCFILPLDIWLGQLGHGITVALSFTH